MSEQKTYTVSYLKRMDVRVHATSPLGAVALACPWWASQQQIDGNLLLGVAEGEHGVKSGLNPLSGPHKPPTGPNGGTPTIQDQTHTEARAA